MECKTNGYGQGPRMENSECNQPTLLRRKLGIETETGTRSEEKQVVVVITKVNGRGYGILKPQ